MLETVVTTRLTPEDVAALRERAAVEQRTLANLVRKIITEGLRAERESASALL